MTDSPMPEFIRNQITNCLKRIHVTWKTESVQVECLGHHYEFEPSQRGARRRYPRISIRLPKGFKIVRLEWDHLRCGGESESMRNNL